MRRLTILLALAALPLLAAACTGADAKQAQDLLAQSQVAAQSVRSEGFTMQVTLTGAGESAAVDMQGGMLLKGARAGDFYATMTTSAAPGAAPVDAVMVKRGPLVQMHTNGVTRTFPFPAGSKQAAAGFDLNAITPYVKDVTVSPVDVNGQTEDKVVGTIDGDALLKSLPGVSTGVLANLGASLGEIKVSLFIPRDSHLVETALLDMNMHVAKQTMHVAMSYGVASVNKPLTFP